MPIEKNSNLLAYISAILAVGEEYFNYTIELMKRLCHSSAKLRFGDILFFEYHLDEDTDESS